MITLKVIVEEMLGTDRGGVGQYTRELTRGLVATAPPGCTVEGVVAASTEPEYEQLERSLPGLTSLYKSALAHRELVAAWQHGFTRLPGHGMVHATSLLAPLYRHDRVNNVAEQTVVTIRDATPWTHPESFTPKELAWHRTMSRRALKYADAIIVPTHAVAAELAVVLDYGDRVRVISEAISSDLIPPNNVEAAERLLELGLPTQFIATEGTLDPNKGLPALLDALKLLPDQETILVVLGTADWQGKTLSAAVSAAGLSEERVRAMGNLSMSDRAIVLSQASAFVFPSRAEGFGIPMLDALSLGTPVIHSDATSLIEVAADSAVVVESEPLSEYPAKLADAIQLVQNDRELSDRLRASGPDRARIFNWLASAEKVWQLHADL